MDRDSSEWRRNWPENEDIELLAAARLQLEDPPLQRPVRIRRSCHSRHRLHTPPIPVDLISYAARRSDAASCGGGAAGFGIQATGGYEAKSPGVVTSFDAVALRLDCRNEIDPCYATSTRERRLATREANLGLIPLPRDETQALARAGPSRVNQMRVE